MVKNNIVLSDMKYIYSTVSELGKFSNKSILITGAGGFLGYYFVNFFDYLAGMVKIKKVVLLDNFILGRPDWTKKLKNSPCDFEIHAFDIARQKVSTIKSASDVDYVIHMASIASPTYYRKYPLETVDANVWGLRNLLEYYKNSTIQGFLFFSSSEIYGDPPAECIPIRENYRGNVSCVGPRACYDESKRFGEMLCYNYAKNYDMPVIIVRPFNNFGPGMRIDDRRLPADLARAVIQKKDMIIHSDGSPTRTFCYVADAIAGYLKALLYGSFDYFNIGRDKPEIPVTELAGIYRSEGFKINGYRGRIIYRKSKDSDYLAHNPSRRCPDINKAKKLLNFNPRIDIAEGVRRYIAYLSEEGRQR